jgi:hypothetical protein
LNPWAPEPLNPWAPEPLNPWAPEPMNQPSGAKRRQLQTGHVLSQLPASNFLFLIDLIGWLNGLEYFP